MPELDVLHSVTEVDSITGRVDTLVTRVQVLGQGGGDALVTVVKTVQSHHPGTQLQQRGWLQLHVSDEPHHQGIVSQR